ncbi:Glycerophosphodiester phosphodiesterase gde1 [Echinococcus granulosus]|uniref:Glycerophosphodiester phosphodiesterase gde1 n=1 Tax=Echinococcus granulosus TaxID=6210 RepID=W6UHM8_ECHGR|nr:Glycerophosphodiester phosphodiesterase gde1 [Echinococcus granulosus]EUB61010.1 Glycerophosphodiester phosphodiesterase gde1 [Echinococcus granulosus]
MDSVNDQFREVPWKLTQNGSYETPSEYYDTTQQFLESFQLLEFPSFESLRVALKNFTEETGYVYTIKRSKRYREDDSRRDVLVYNHICYGCTLHVQGSSHSNKRLENPCPSQINFTSVKGAFKVAKFSMVHNHPPPMSTATLELDSSAFPDCSDSFREAFPTMSAGSYVEFTNRLKQFEKTTGSVYIKYSSGLFGNTGGRQEALCKYKKLRYVCVHYGSRRSEPIRRRNQHTTKIGCGSCFSVKYCEGRLRIVSYDMRHCHPVDPESAMLYPHNRRLTPAETAEIEQILAFNPNMGELKHHIKEKYGKICTTRDIINMRFRRKKRLERSSLNSTEELKSVQAQSLLPSSPLLPSSTSTLPTGAKLESLVDICCQQQIHQRLDGEAPEVEAEEGEEEDEDEGVLSPALQDIQQIAEAAPAEEIVGIQSVLRNLANAWQGGQQPVVVVPKALSPYSKAIIVYFCGLRSQLYSYLQVKSVYANSDRILLKNSSCLLRLGPSHETSWRIEGEMVTRQWVPMKINDTITGLLCRCSSEIPINRWTIEVNLSEDPSNVSVPMVAKFVCPTNIATEAGSETVNIDSGGGELDVYYLTIRPTLPLETNEGHSFKKNSARGFTLRPVDPAVGLDEASLLCVGHRGMGAEKPETPADEQWPENTLLSFNKAAELNVPMVELDVQPLRDSNDLVIYHSFNIVTKRSDRIRPCGCPKYEVDVFGESGICNKKMPNLIPTFFLNELQDLKWGLHSKTCEKSTHEYEAAVENAKSEVKNGGEVSNSCLIPLRRGTQQAEYLPFFSQVLATVPTRLALDVELKYPQDTPNMAFKLVHEMGVDRQALDEFGHPSRYFYSINQFADNVIRSLQTQGNGREIVLSTFNADLCLALRLKQTTFPVLFISRAGCEQPLSVYTKAIPPSHSSTRLPPPPHLLDPRHRNAAAVVEWAHLIGMDGVVIPGKPFETATAEGAGLAHRMAAFRLACIPFGACVSTPTFKRRAAELGLTGICIDDVHRNAW